jgi:sterol desaturase/sphingolipid hydroxylase (fatty acid hydroxylase superfamily)
MGEWNESIVRVAAFAVTLAVLAVAEWRWHLRIPARFARRRTNVELFALNTLIVRLLPGASLVALAAAVELHRFGLFAVLDWSPPVEVGLSVIALDASMYLQHRLFHWLPWLWRLHAVHHSDVAFDVTTGLRFHPGEIVVSLALKAATVVALGATPGAVIVFQVLLSSASMFSHANFALPSAADRIIRRLVVTPNMHRIHHSIDRDEHNRNFGFLLVWWDRWFGSYQESPRMNPQTMHIGLSRFRIESEQRLVPLLRQPFRAGKWATG